MKLLLRGLGCSRLLRMALEHGLLLRANKVSDRCQGATGQSCMLKR
jgi:hypothetical protein